MKEIYATRYDDGFFTIFVDGREQTEPLIKVKEILLFLEAVLNFSVDNTPKVL